jgi:lysyl endopeptidase
LNAKIIVFSLINISTIHMNISLRLLLAAYTLSILTACGNNSSNTTTGADGATNKSATVLAVAAAPLPTAVDAYRPPASVAAQESPMKPRDLRTAPSATNIAMGAPLASQIAAAQRNNQASSAEDHMGKPLQIGFNRDVPQTSTVAATQQMLNWQTSATGGQVAAINFNSTGAKGIRIGLLVTQLPETATLRFYAKDAATAFVVKGADVLKVLATNLASGDKSDNARTYWSPFIDGSNGTIEIETRAGVVATSLDVSVPSVTHLFMSTKESSTAASQLTYSGDTNLGLSCQVDVKCTTPLPAASDAVAHIIFNKSGGSYICSGTMLNDNINSSTPYFLTANHCIPDQTVASTLTTWFKYRSLTCNDGTTGEYYPTALNQGAALLYTAYGTDSTLLRLNGVLPTTVLFAGWDSTPPAATTTVHNIHHPKGDQQRLSRGSLTSYSTRSATNPNLFIGSNISSGTILDVTLTTGLTEGGSSGSGLFKGTDTNPQLIGQLFGGQVPSCTNTTVNNVYGRFDIAFNAGMSDWLQVGRKPVYRFYNTGNGSHFYSISANETSYVKANIPQYYYEGPAFKAEPAAVVGTSAVYRFYNATTRAHFYTISAIEKADVIARLPQFAYEGVSWYAKDASQVVAGDGTVPLYRFYNLTNGTHFYTHSLLERDSVKTNLAHIYYYEGPAYYVWP